MASGAPRGMALSLDAALHAGRVQGFDRLLALTPLDDDADDLDAVSGSPAGSVVGDGAGSGSDAEQRAAPR